MSRITVSERVRELEKTVSDMDGGRIERIENMQDELLSNHLPAIWKELGSLKGSIRTVIIPMTLTLLTGAIAVLIAILS